MINCVIIDDEPYARNLLEDYIGKVPYLELLRSFSSGLNALETLRKNSIDLLFLDIQMPEINGITFLKSLQNNPNVIFTTAYAEYAVEGFELNAKDYLLKPFDFPRFLMAVEKIYSTVPQINIDRDIVDPVKYLFVKDGSTIVKISLSEIQFIKGLKDYVQIVTSSKKVMSLQTLKELSYSLPGQSFARVHNSFIIGLHHIDSIQNNHVNIKEVTIPIGPTYKKTFMESLIRIGISK
tara:strand:- start:26932 stop:27642 length:711 start_codon:yes stop_codon:yes gene_type:complete